MHSLRVMSLPVAFTRNNRSDTLWLTLIQKGDLMVLVDTGYEGFLPLIKEAARQYQVDLGRLTDIIITHHDIDHVGALYEFKKAYPSITIHASEMEAAFIEGIEKSPRLIQAEALYPSLPEEHKPWALGFQRQLAAIKAVPVDNILYPGTVSWLLPLQVIKTPGHTPGHISLYEPESETLIAADALVIEDGHLNIANPTYTIDLAGAIASVKLLSQFPVSRLICYHGGEMTEEIKSEFDRLIHLYTA